MNATREVAEAGWMYFRVREPQPSMEEVNEYLRQCGMSPIAHRMMRHYRKLAAYGCSEYMPINELDVRTKAGQLELPA